MNKTKMKKISDITLSVLLCVFLAISLFSLTVTIFSRRGADGAADIFGYRILVVTSNSMAECEHTDVSQYKIKDIPVRSMVFVQGVPEDAKKAAEWYDELKVGDVLTFRYVYSKQVTITHRITSITPKETGGYILELAGDNKNSEDGQVTQTIDTSVTNSTNYVIGKVTAKSLVLGVILTALQSPVGLVLAIIVPCFAIILLEVLKIMRMFGEEKRKKVQAEVAQKESELEELRRKVQELEQLTAETSDPQGEENE